MFDFKYDGPGIAKGGTGVLTVDGAELATQKLEHTIPFLLPPDETFDVGVDTARPWTAAIRSRSASTARSNKLTFKLGPTQLAEAEQKQVQKAVAKARTRDHDMNDARQDRSTEVLAFASVVEIATGLALLIDPSWS